MRLGVGRIAPSLTTLLLAVAPAGSLAQEPAAPPQTVTAFASAAVAVVHPKHLTNATVSRSVLAARTKAGPAAVLNARREATRLAAAAGLTLGALESVAEQPPSPFVPYGGAIGIDGTFGPGKFCGRIRTPVFKRDKHGRNVFQQRFHSHFGCRVPGNVTITVSATFSAG
jgi:hypothetical protein